MGPYLIKGLGPSSHTVAQNDARRRTAPLTAIDVKVVRELQGVVNSFGADLGLLVSWGGFTSKADEEARRNFFKIRLWDPDTLITQIQSV